MEGKGEGEGEGGGGDAIDVVLTPSERRGWIGCMALRWLSALQDVASSQCPLSPAARLDVMTIFTERVNAENESATCIHEGTAEF